MRKGSRMEEDCQGDGSVLHVDLLYHGFPYEHSHHRKGAMTTDTAEKKKNTVFHLSDLRNLDQKDGDCFFLYINTLYFKLG